MESDMLLQRIIFPTAACDEFEMYFRDFDPSCVTAEDEIAVKAGRTLSLDTYFNSFSVGKWKKYTRLYSLSFCFAADCACKLSVFHAQAVADNEQIARFRRNENFTFDVDGISDRIRSCISVTERKIDCVQTVVQQGNKKLYSCTVKELPPDGILYVTLTPECDARISGMKWCSGEAACLLNDIKIAVGICTFRREQSVTRNIRGIIEKIIENSHSCLYGNLEVYLADNGRTLLQEAFPSSKVHIFPNINLGGSAGFTRTMMESIFRDSNKRFTHIVLMDDDVILLPEVLERTCLFLRLLKDEYKESMLGAAMFHEDKRYYQHENGALYDGSRYFKVSGRFYDMRKKEFVVLNTEPAAVNYQGWWYCCIPAIVVRRRMLPLPFFIHYDDIEYSLRNRNHELLLLNGICVWHPQFQNKDPVWTTYYNTRNFLILSALYAYNTRTKVVWLLFKLFLYFLLSYHYRHIFLLRQGISDFLQGTDFFCAQDALRNHSEVSTCAYKKQRPETLGIDIQNERLHSGSCNLFLSVIKQFLCLLLPLSGKTKVFDMAVCNYIFDARRCYVYDRHTEEGVLYERSILHFFSESFHAFLSLVSLFFGFGKAKKMYKFRMKECIGLDFWNQYLRGKNVSSQEHCRIDNGFLG